MNNIITSIKTNTRESLIIMKKDLNSYFTTPIAYIVIGSFLILTGIFFFMDFFIINLAELRYFFQLMPIFFAFLVPIITMRLFAEERSSGSFETLVTMPVTTGDIVAGKIMAASVFVIIMLLPTLIYPISISFISNLDIGPIIGGYLGAILLGAAYSAIGVLASSYTQNQIIAAIISIIICIFISFLGRLFYLTSFPFVKYIELIGADYHFRNIAKGVIDSRNILYFFSIIAICWFCTVKIIDERR